MGMEPHPQGPGQGRAFPQQVGGDRKRRAGGQGHLPHGVAGIVVPDPHQPLGVQQDLVDGLHHAVRRQAAVLLGEVHGAAGGMEPDAQLGRRPELGGDQVPRALGKDVVVVKAGGGTGLEQLAQTGERREGHRLLVQALPDVVQRDQPGEQLHGLDLRQITGKNLIKVMVGVDEARVDRHVRGIDGLIGRTQFRPDGCDHAVLQIEIGVVVDRVLVVAGDDAAGVFDEQGSHKRAPPFQRSRVLHVQYSIGRGKGQSKERRTAK